jgi:hypothetical protein
MSACVRQHLNPNFKPELNAEARRLPLTLLGIALAALAIAGIWAWSSLNNLISVPIL